MHEMERAVAEHLARMKDHFGVVSVKAEFEAQGMPPHELKRLDEIANHVGLRIALKVGGAEAVTDMKLALEIGVGAIIFPMVETAYALEKGLKAAKDVMSPGERGDLHLAVNIETKTACQNLTDILVVGRMYGLDAVTLGRVDLVGSLGLTRADINSDRIFGFAHDVCSSVREASFEMTIGGGIEVESYDFIQRLVEENLLDRFETRMIVFPALVAKSRDSFELAVRQAHKFELLWSKYWTHRYQAQMLEHQKRQDMLKKRVGEE